MPTDLMLAALKRKGPMTLRELQNELALGETSVRHHVSRLLQSG